MSQFEDLLQTKMTRKQFLRTVGAGLVAVCGLSTIVHILDYSGDTNQVPRGYGYGSRDYGA